MKKPVSSALWRLFFILLVLFSVFIIHSCRKSGNDSNNSAKPHISQAKKWYENAYPVTANKNLLLSSIGDGSTTPDMSQLITPDWDNANDYTRLDKHVIEIPMDGSVNWQSDLKAGSTGKTNTFKNYSRTSFLIFGSAENYTAYIMTVIADSAYINNDFTKLSQNTFQHHDPNFSGKLLYFTPKGKFVSGWIYKKGKLTAALTSTGTKQTNSLKLLDGPVGTDPTQDGDGSSGGSGNCTDWWYVLRIQGEIISTTYLGRTCDGTTPQGPSDGQYTFPEQTGGVVNIPPEPEFRIIDSIDEKYVCAKYLLAQLPKLKDSLSQLINTTFGATGSHDISFKDRPANQLKDTTEDGESKGYNISLNQNVLAKASGEYILATMYHEALHSFLFLEYVTLGETAFNAKYPEILIQQTPYINASGMLKYTFTFDEGNRVTTVLSDPNHRTMAEYFVSKIIDGILAYNPNFPPERARALARYGIFIDTTILDMNNQERDKTKGESKGIPCP